MVEHDNPQVRDGMSGANNPSAWELAQQASRESRPWLTFSFDQADFEAHTRC